MLATYTYDNLQRRTGVANGNGTSSSYSFDPVSRLASLTQDLAGTPNDLTVTISAYNPASQIVTQSRSNDLYAWTGHGNGSTDTVTNGLNQLATVGGVAATHDARGNLTLDPTTGNSYAYSSENLLTSATVGGNAVTLAYDPLLRLTQVAGTATTRFGYDGLDTTIETDSAGTTILRRYAPGDGIDQPIVWYEGSATADRRWLHADERGSIVAVSDASGNMLGINTYDEFGKPGAANTGRFQYTGQKWIGELGVYDYKARMYAPALGRFLQTDPIGYGSGPNIYAYVRGDPVNLSDPLGLSNSGSADLSNVLWTDQFLDAVVAEEHIYVTANPFSDLEAQQQAASANDFRINGASYGYNGSTFRRQPRRRRGRRRNPRRMRFVLPSPSQTDSAPSAKFSTFSNLANAFRSAGSGPREEPKLHRSGSRMYIKQSFRSHFPPSVHGTRESVQ